MTSLYKILFNYLSNKKIGPKIIIILISESANENIAI